MMLLAQAGVSQGSAEFWVFWPIAVLSLGSAIAMVTLRNAVHSALMLVLNLFTIALLFAVLEAQFLATVQLIVYAGAIMVLFLFVIMLLGVARDQVFTGGLPGQRPAALLLGAVLLVSLSVGVAGPYLSSGSACNAPPPPGSTAPPCLTTAAATPPLDEGGNVGGIGRLLFTDYVWPFEVTSVLLVLAAIGAMVLGRRHENPEDLMDVVPDSERLPARREPAPSSEPTERIAEPSGGQQ